MSDYGKRGGTSKNAGRKASTYTATAPDGTILTKRSYEIDTPTAYMAAYNSHTGWSANSIVKKIDENGHPCFRGRDQGVPEYTALTATRIS